MRKDNPKGNTNKSAIIAYIETSKIKIEYNERRNFA